MTTEQSHTPLRQRVVELAYAVTIAAFLVSLHNKSATALANVGAWAPGLLWLVRPLIAPTPRPYLHDRLLKLLLAFIVIVELSCLWSPQPLQSFSQFRREFAIVLSVTLSLADAQSTRQAIARWCLALVFGLAWNASLHLRDWVLLSTASGQLLPEYGLLRDYGYGLVFALPFVFAAMKWAGPVLARSLLALLVLCAVLAVTTGSRGTWFAFALTTLGGALFLISRRLAVVLLAIALGSGALFAVTEPGNPITINVERGIDSSFRLSGTWTPAVEMIAERPIVGHGMGRFVFDEAYKFRKPSRPHWHFERSLGPHSLFFEIAFAGGLVALAAYVSLCAAIVDRALRLARAGDWRASVATGVLLSFAGQYLVYGFFESISWHPLGVHIGLLIALSGGNGGGRNFVESATPGRQGGVA